MTLAKHKTVRQALESTANDPEIHGDTIAAPVWKLVCVTLFDIANKPDPKVRGAMARATRAQKIILDRMVGLRKPGSHPAQMTNDEIEFLDLTQPVYQEVTND